MYYFCTVAEYSIYIVKYVGVSSICKVTYDYTHIRTTAWDTYYESNQNYVL